MTGPSGAVAEGAPVLVGVDIGGTKVLGVALDAAGTVVAEARASTPAAATNPTAAGSEDAAGEVAAAVAGVVRALAARCAGIAAGDPLGGDPSGGDSPGGAPTGGDPPGGDPPGGDPPGRGASGQRRPAVRLGLGVPGMLDSDGTLRFSPNLPGAAGAALGPLVGACLAQGPPSGATPVTLVGPVTLAGPVAADNDANCAARAELVLGAARGAGNAVVVTLGTGIGGGIVVGGTLWRGANRFAGEIGHMVVDPDGPACPCGARGCWERYASGGGLARLAREAAYAGTLPAAVALAGGDPEAVRGEHVTAAAATGDPGALAVMDQLGWWVALGLANLAAILDPERFVVGGGLAAVGEMLLGPVRRAVGQLLEGSASRPAIPVLPAALGERAGAIGAALLGAGPVGPPGHGPARSQGPGAAVSRVPGAAPSQGPGPAA